MFKLLKRITNKEDAKNKVTTYRLKPEIELLTRGIWELTQEIKKREIEEDPIINAIGLIPLIEIRKELINLIRSNDKVTIITDD